jgi:AP-3 complex subunit beta
MTQIADDAGPSEYQVGSMSRVTGKRLTGYQPLPEWTDEPTDASLRETEAPQTVEPVRSSAPTPRIATPTNIASAPSPAPVPVHVSSSAASLPRSTGSSMVSPAGSLPHTATKGKFQDLDKFLDSESETDEEEDEEDSDDSDAGRPAPRAVTAPPRSAIVPEYDEDTSEEEEDEEETESEEEQAPLYGQYR